MHTFKFYNKKGERLGIFMDLESIYVYRCSKQDNFWKKKIKEAHASKDSAYHPEIIPLLEKMTGKEFVKWCRTYYYTAQKFLIPAEYTVMYIGDKFHKLSSIESMIDVKRMSAIPLKQLLKKEDAE